MLGWLIFLASACAAIMWGNWFAIGVAVVNFWSLGIMHNYAEDSGPNGPIRSGNEHFAITINAISGLAGIGLFLAALLR
jgi:hypothetical protein